MIVDIREKRFGSKLVLSGFSMEISDGERIAITGPSGRGKTTLLRILAGLDTDFTGSISEPYSMPAVLFQEDRLVETISAAANLRAVSDDGSIINKTLAVTGLESEGQNIVSTLSGGMKRRLAIARLLLLDKDIVFLDEPFRALDDDNKTRLADVISGWAGDAPVVFVTHDDEDIRLLGADRVISL